LVSLVVIALARCRLHISIVFIASILRAIVALAFAPDLTLSIHILAAPRAGGARAHARPWGDFDIVCAAVVRLGLGMVRRDVARRWRWSRHGRRGRWRLNEHRHRLRCGDLERLW
jgi:hypothetical protein